jgi:hypothetical protein
VCWKQGHETPTETGLSRAYGLQEIGRHHFNTNGSSILHHRKTIKLKILLFYIAGASLSGLARDPPADELTRFVYGS